MGRLDAGGLDEVRAAVVATLGAGAQPLAEALGRHARDVGQYEASVRSTSTGLRGGRMMIERAPISSPARSPPPSPSSCRRSPPRSGIGRPPAACR